MALLHCTHGKARVRIMRIERETPHHKVRELTVQTMLEGGIDRCFTDGDNSTVVATDTVKNIINIVARENLTAATEPFCGILAQRFLNLYPHTDKVTVTAHETKWSRLNVNGAPHDHSFVLDSNGKPFVKLTLTREGAAYESGISGFTFMKTTESGWENYIFDKWTTIPPTHDRMAATSMDATWVWSREPSDFEAANAQVLRTMLDVFASTYSVSVQNSMYNMCEAALAAVPEIAQVRMSCPNKHYLLINLKPFELDNNNQVFVATDEPHGQIECVVGRT